MANINENGAVQTLLTLDPSSNNIAHVEAYLLDNDGASTSPVVIKIGVVPGKPYSIELASTGSAYLKGNGQIELDAIVKDASRNLVTNGTGVLLREHGHINVKTTSGITDNGKVRATLTGGSIAGSYAIDVYSGEAFATTNVSVSSLDVEVSGIPDTIQAGETYTFTATVSGGNGSLEGIFLDMGVDGGMISQRDLVTNTNGEIQFQYQAPMQAGNYQLGVKLDLNIPSLFNLNVAIRNEPDSLIPERAYLVAGASSQLGSVTNYQNETATITYPEEAVLNLKGTAGENWTLSLNDPHLPNVEPVYFTRFNELFKDATRTFSSFSENVSKSSSAYAGLFALKQDPGSVTTPWQLNNASEFLITQPSYNLWLNLAAEGDILTVAKGYITLSYNAGQLIATAQSTNGEGDKQTTTASIPAITTNQWYAVAIAVQSGQLTLSVNEQQNTAALAGNNISYNSVSGDSPWLSFSRAFSGKAAGLRIYDLDGTPLLELASSSGTFDATGNATANIQLTSAAKNNALTQTSVTVGIQNTGIQNGADGTDNTTLNILSEDAINGMANVLHSVTSSSSLHSDAIVRVMPLNLYFPDPKSSGSQYVSGFALQSNNDASLQNVLANLAWLKLENKYPVLHDDVATLQQYFADQQHADLTHYMAEYIQEATVQASNGNNFWLRAMATSFKVWAELAAHNPQEAGQIAGAIQNRTDFWAWVRILSIPANGWATDSVPLPRPDITCDKVAATVNVGTPLEFSPEPCRASGLQMAGLVQTLNEIDSDIQNRPELLTIYMTHMLASVRHMPMEYKKWFSGNSNDVAFNSYGLIQEAHAAIPVVVGYAFRAMAIALKQTIRKASGGAPANFVAFLQEGTTSRVDAKELLPAIAYLSSRYDDASDELCNGCKKLRQQVSDTVKSDIATWFVGMGLSRKGKIESENFKKQSCTLGFNTHGKAFEILGTAMYHALYEFGGKVGMSDAGKYEILSSDPRKGDFRIEVGLMEEDRDGELKLYDDPIQRVPDLVLQGGSGTGKRIWVEFKSWKFNKANSQSGPSYIINGELNKDVFKYWNGVSNSSEAGYTANANRQHFLDYAANSNELIDDYWEDEGADYLQWKPNKHHTWMQVWQDGEKARRTWRALEKVNGKYALAKRPTSLLRASSWIGTDGIVATVPSNFQRLQEFIAGVGPNLDGGMYEASLGHKKSAHDEKYRDKQVASNFAELQNSNVRPFNVPTFLALELGETSQEKVADLKKELLDSIGNGDFSKLQDAIERNNLTETQVAEMRDLISSEIDELLGPLQYLLFDVPFLSDLEDAAADMVISEELEQRLQNGAAEIELPAEQFENSCEI